MYQPPPLCQRNIHKLTDMLTTFRCPYCEQPFTGRLEDLPLGKRRITYVCACQVTIDFQFRRKDWTWSTCHYFSTQACEWYAMYLPTHDMTLFGRVDADDSPDEHRFDGFLSTKRFLGLLIFS